MQTNKLKVFKILKGEKIVIRRRFPNFVCDGRPLGPEPELYLHSIIIEEDFYTLDWVKEIMSDPNFKSWFVEAEKICARYGTDTAWHAVVEEGEISFANR